MNRFAIHLLTAVAILIGGRPINGTALSATSEQGIAVRRLSDGVASGVRAGSRQTRYHVSETAVFTSAAHPNALVSQLGQLAGALFVDREHVVIADRTNGNLHNINVLTSEASTVGRMGEGPGEFRGLIYVMRTANGYAAWDAALARITRFRQDGSLNNTWTYDFNWFDNPAASPVAMFSDGTVVFRDGDRPGIWRDGRRRGRARYVEVGDDGVKHVLGEFECQEYLVRDGAFQEVLAGHRVFEAQLGQGLAVAQTDAGVVQLLDRNGQVSTELPLPEGRELSPRQMKSLREAERQRLRRRAERAHGMFRERHLERLARVSDAHVNDMTPSIDKMFVDLDGRLWMRLYSLPHDDERRWEVWDTGNASAPKSVVIMRQPGEVLDAAGELVIVKEMDELDVVRVVVRQLTRS